MVVVVVVVCGTPEEKYIEICQKTSSEITFRSPRDISEDNTTMDLRKGGARMWIGFSWIGTRSDCWLCKHTCNYGLVQSRNIVTTHKGVYTCQYVPLTAQEDLTALFRRHSLRILALPSFTLRR